MSTYEDYETSSKSYDGARTACGSDVMCGMIQLYTGKQLQDLHVLDAGCGTGNYAKALLDYGVGHVSLLDASSGMLSKARDKLADDIAAGKVKDVIETKMPPIPFQDASFDAVMLNCVVHHLDSDVDGNYPTATAVLSEARRVLKPGGVIIISTVLPWTIENSVWNCQLHPELTKRFIHKMPTLDSFNQMFKRVPMHCVQKLNILGSDWIKDYFNFEGPLDDTWRKSVSYWSYATDEELDAIKRKVVQLKEAGELDTWGRQHDHTDTAGMLTVMFCRT